MTERRAMENNMMNEYDKDCEKTRVLAVLMPIARCVDQDVCRGCCNNTL